MVKRWKTVLLVALVAMFTAVSAWAITLQEAARKVAREYDARVLSAKTVTRNGQRVHEIKIVTKAGVVKTVRVPENGG